MLIVNVAMPTCGPDIDLSEPGRVACNGDGPRQSTRYRSALEPVARRHTAGGTTDSKVPPSASPHAQPECWTQNHLHALRIRSPLPMLQG